MERAVAADAAARSKPAGGRGSQPRAAPAARRTPKSGGPRQRAIQNAKSPAEVLRFSVPSGRRFEGRALDFLESCGFRVRKETERQLTAELGGFPGVTVVFQRARDILTQVSIGKADLGITGLDFLHEFAAEDDDLVVVADSLGFSSGDIVVAVPNTWVDVTTLADLSDVAAAMRERGQALRVATSYPNLARRFFYDKGITHFSVVVTEGGVEAAPIVDFADIIVEFVASGVSLQDNRLKVVRNGVVMHTEACLIGNRRALAASPEKRERTRRIVELIEARLRAHEYYSVTANLRGRSEAEVARALLGCPATRGMRGPTVARVYAPDDPAGSANGAGPAAGSWFAATILVDAAYLQEAVDHLRAVGGSGMSVVPVRYLFDQHSHRYAALLAELGVEDARRTRAPALPTPPGAEG
jgi:ATP phosphoribosyltransferase